MKIWMLLLVAVLGLVSCRKQVEQWDDNIEKGWYDVRTFTVNVPDMQNAACARIIRGALAKVEGVNPNKIEENIDARTVTVTYDSLQCAHKNIQFAVAEAGFRVINVDTNPLGVTTTNEIPANANARAALPADCRP